MVVLPQPGRGEPAMLVTCEHRPVSCAWVSVARYRLSADLSVVFIVVLLSGVVCVTSVLCAPYYSTASALVAGRSRTAYRVPIADCGRVRGCMLVAMSHSHPSSLVGSVGYPTSTSSYRKALLQLLSCVYNTNASAPKPE
jgi:hypothetical protein